MKDNPVSFSDADLVFMNWFSEVPQYSIDHRGILEMSSTWSNYNGLICHPETANWKHAIAGTRTEEIADLLVHTITIPTILTAGGEGMNELYKLAEGVPHLHPRSRQAITRPEIMMRNWLWSLFPIEEN
jgi:hypothetical protein